jgi:tRNA A37 threonylcarbamoyladenosine dehydratase
MHPFHRTELLVGSEQWARLQAARVLVVGLGGVGSYAAEAITRAGVGRVGLVDFDQVCVTNLNRQLHAFRRTVGRYKSELMAERAAAINPKAEILPYRAFYDERTSEEILGAPGEERWDYVIDCVDNITAKLHLLETCWRRGLPVVSSMGAGGRMDPTRVRVTDLSRTHTDPFARVVRKQLRRRGVVLGVTAVWTDEPPNQTDQEVADAFRCICPGGANEFHSCEERHVIQGTVSFLPAIFGMTAAGSVINTIVGRQLATQEGDRPGRAPAAAGAAPGPEIEA